MRAERFGRLALAWGLAVAPWLAQASPTADEFEPCREQAVARLDACLREAAPSAPEACWRDSRVHMARCRTAVHERHDPRRRRAEAADAERARKAASASGLR